MARLIDVDSAVKAISRLAEDMSINDRAVALLLALELNNEDRFPTADVIPVVHGKWEDEGIEHYSSCDFEDWQSAKCSKCGKWHTTPFMYYFDNYNYCPNCGARMDEVTE